MISLKDGGDELALKLDCSEKKISGYKKFLEKISPTDLEKISREEVKDIFNNHFNLANSTALVLAMVIDELKLEEPNLTEIQDTLGLVIRAIQLQQVALSQGIRAGFEVLAKRASNRAKTAANALHDRDGGSRSKADEIRRLWASGKFKSRDICAEEECASLGMSFSAARKALRRTPEPT